MISERHSLRFRGTSISRIELAGSRALEFSLRCWLRIPTATTGILARCWALGGQAPKSILLLHLLLAYAAVLGLVIGDLALLLAPCQPRIATVLLSSCLCAGRVRDGFADLRTFEGFLAVGTVARGNCITASVLES